MIRVIGILVGAAIAVGFLIIALGVPEFSAPADDTPPAIEELEVSLPSAEPLPLEPEQQPVIATSAPAAADTEAEVPAVSDEQLVEQIFNPPPQPAVEEHWYAFWSPFRSEIAANGFISRLQQTTGMDYRVVKLKPGVYEVAFAYIDEADIEDKLARISDATGLDMSGG